MGERVGWGLGVIGAIMLAVYIGAVQVDLLLGDVASLKQKRAVLRPLVADLRRHFEVAVAETGQHDLLRRTMLGVATVSGTAEQVARVCDQVERWAWSRPDVEVLQVRRMVRSIDD